jgi:hypothetical protein
VRRIRKWEDDDIGEKRDDEKEEGGVGGGVACRNRKGERVFIVFQGLCSVCVSVCLSVCLCVSQL